MPNGADALALEQERKRELYRDRQQAGLEKSDPPEEEMEKRREEVAERFAKAGEKWGEEGAKAKIGAAKEALAGIRAAGGVEELAEMVGKEGSQLALRTLWGSLLGIVTFIPCLLGLNLYFGASQGALDGIWPISPKIAPFGLFNRFLPGALGKWLGIIVLIMFDLLVIAVILAILTFIAFLVWFFFEHSWADIWDKLKMILELFKGLG